MSDPVVPGQSLTHQIVRLSRFLLFNESPPEVTEETFSNLQIYKNNRILGLTGSLLRKYPVTTKVLSQENLLFFAKEFVQENPSTKETLDLYGDSLPFFLENRDELKSLPYLPELAKMDWFFFCKGGSERKIYLQKGILDLWEAIYGDESIENCNVVDDREWVYAKIDSGRLSFCKGAPRR